MTHMAHYLKNTALSLGIDYPLLLAITKVEANSKGFIAPHKPIILFENDIFFIND